MKTLILIGIIATIVLSANLRTETQGSLDQEGKVFHVPLTKRTLSSEEKAAHINFVRMQQKYMFGDVDLDYNDFESEFYSDQKSEPVQSDHTNYLQSSLDAKNKAQSKAAQDKFKTIPLNNFKNTQYTGQFALGDENNTFDVIFDTGSANLWIDSVKCHDKGCKNHKQYDGKQYQTYKPLDLSLDVEFGTGALSGDMSKDTAYFGGVPIDGQSFAEIASEDGDVFAQSKFDGIVGLAYPSMAAYGSNPVFDNIIEQHKLESNVFSFFFSQNEGQADSKITVGGTDPSLYTGDIHYHKVIDEYYWEMKADNILVGGEDIGLCDGFDGCKVIADTGTSLLTGPTDNLFSLLTKINVDDNCHQVESLPTISFIMDGQSYDLAPSEYVMSVTDNGVMESYGSMSSNEKNSQQCAAAFMPLDIPDKEGPAWILGDVFLNKYYSVYNRDSNSVGFAKAKHY